MEQGLDVKAASMYLRQLRKGHDKKYGIRVLYEVSGWKKANKAINWAGKANLPFCIIDLVWKDDHKFGEQERLLAIQRAKEVAIIINKYPNIKWYVCPYLEPKGVTVEDYQKVIDQCSSRMPLGVTMISNAIEGYEVKNSIRAGHHGWYKPGMEIFSYDGIDCKDSSIRAVKRKAIQGGASIFLLWTYSFNGKYGAKDKRLREARTSYPKAIEIKGVTKILDKPPVETIPTTWIHKPFAEQYNPPVSRGNKPVWVIPIKADKIELRTTSGKLIYTYKYEKPYEHGQGLYTYRGDIYPYKIWRRTFKASGKTSDYADVYVDGTRYGQIHPCQRAGKFLT